MSRIPDCRNDENYNEKYLNKRDKEFVSGYDWCTECAVDTFFDNLDAFISVDSVLMDALNKELPDCMKSEEEIEFTFGTMEKEVRKIETYGDLLRSQLLEYIENERDELITSMIDSMDDNEYELNKAKANGEQE